MNVDRCICITITGGVLDVKKAGGYDRAGAITRERRPWLTCPRTSKHRSSASSTALRDGS